MRSLLVSTLLLLLILPALADPKADALAASKAFDQAAIKARSLSELYPFVTADSVKMLSALSAADQKKWLDLMGGMLKIEAAEGFFPLVDSNVGPNKATLTFRRTKEDKSSKETLVKEVHLLKENNVWKVDVSDYKLP